MSKHDGSVSQFQVMADSSRARPSRTAPSRPSASHLASAQPAEDGPVESSDDARRWTSPATWKALARLVALRVRTMVSAKTLAAVVVAVVFAASLWVIGHELRGFEYAEVWSHLTALPAAYVAGAVVLTLLNFAVLSGYDALALRYVGARLSYPRIALSAFVGYAVSQAVGNPILTGGSVRYRLYSSWGMSGADIAKSVLFAGTSFWLGFFTLGSVLFLFQPLSLPSALNLPTSPMVVGAACLIPMAGYLGLTTFREAPMQVRGVTLDVPPRWMLPAQVGLAAADLMLATSVLYVLLPPSVEVSFLYMLGVYLIALLAGLLSHVPGGLGVFDGLVLMMLTPMVPAPTVAAALLAYRGIFHLFPLAVGMFSFCTYEARRASATS